MMVYLCGAINGCSDAEANDWRYVAKSGLRHETLDPMRRDYRGKEDESVNEIVAGDLKDINESDIVLAACDKPSWGTAMEIHYAHSIGKKVVAICGSSRVSPWLRYHSYTVLPNLNEAIALLNE